MRGVAGCPQARMSAHDPHVHAGASGRGTLRGETRERLCLTLRTNIQLNIHARARLSTLRRVHACAVRHTA